MPSPSGEFYLGLDISTQGAKLVAIEVDKDGKKNRRVGEWSLNYDKDLSHYQTKNGVIQGKPEGVSESDPKMWIEAVDKLFGAFVKDQDPKRVRGISVSGQQHGLVCLDESGELTRKTSKLWNDVSTQIDCEFIIQDVGGIGTVLAEIYNGLRPGYTASKILSFKKEDPKGFKNTDTFFLVHNYINFYLTGGPGAGCRVMEPGDVSGMALWNPGRNAWSEKICNVIDPCLLKKLPKVRPSSEWVGKISPDLTSRFGFSPKCCVAAGSGDNMCAAIGTGNIEEGILTISLGTSGAAYTFLNTPYFSPSEDPNGEIASFSDATGNFLALLCVSNMANGYNQLRQQFNLTHEKFSQIVEKNEIDPSKIVIPWFTGERTPDLPMAKPFYYGFALDEFTPENLCTPILYGHVMNLYRGYSKLPVKAKTVHLTGGLSQSRVWRQAIADIFQATVIPVKGEGAALGAAIQAAWTNSLEGVEGLSVDEKIWSLKKLAAGLVEVDTSKLTKAAPASKALKRYMVNYAEMCAYFEKQSQH